MCFLTIILFLICTEQICGEVLLKKDIKESVQFEGSELIIRLENPHGVLGMFALCFGSYPYTVLKYCPPGFAMLTFGAGPKFKDFQFQINRQGTFHPWFLNFKGPLRFNDDNSIDVLYPFFDDTAKVTLLNAEKVVPTEKPEVVETSTKPGVNKTAIGFVVGGLVLIILAIIIGIVVWFFVCRKKPESSEKVERNAEFAQNQSKKSQKSVKLQSVTTATKPTTTSTTKPSDETVQRR